IPMLARYFAEDYASRNGTPVSALDPHALEALLAHAWPGNVRELKNALARAALLAAGRPIEPEPLPVEVQRSDPAAAVAAGAPVPSGNGRGGDNGGGGQGMVALPVGTSMDDAEREMIRSTLEHTSGNKTRAAKILGISLK